jgi:Cytochrome c7 and related cytochrome c
VSCHSGARPPADGKLSVTGKHIPSSNNCTDCHSATKFDNWKGAKFAHVNIVTGCATCHNGTAATGKLTGPNNKHMPTTESCESCHGTSFVNWNFAKFDHTQTTAACLTCHKNNQTMPLSGALIVDKMHGPNSMHITNPDKTTDDCQSCHTTVTFVPANAFDHGQMTSTDCKDCHNGTTKTSKANPLKFNLTPPHVKISPTAKCTDCHTSFTTWKTALFDHSVLTPGDKCSSCHDGIVATGMPTTGNGHIKTAGADCASCHNNFVTWRPAVMDHTVVASLTCFTCHDGKIAIFAGKLTTRGPNHILPGRNDCESCHTTATWKTVFDHSAVVGQACFSCHNGTAATGKLSLSGFHVTTSDTCETCHVTTLWTAVAFSHADPKVAAAGCATCHSGTTKVSTGFLTTKSSAHVVTALPCETCHTSTVTWKGVIFDHVAAKVVIGAGKCFTCHDGTKAIGKLTITGKHIPSSTTCDACHKNFTKFKPVVIADTHLAAAATPCLTCHNGTDATGKLTKTGKHMASSNLCQSCHVTTAWKPVATALLHADATVMAAKCSSCHNGVDATGKLTGPTGKHIPVTTECSNCHTTAPGWKVTPAVLHADPVVAAQSCQICHNGTIATGKTSKGNFHINSTNLCASCHVTAKWKPIPLANFDHGQTTGTCKSCHDGTIAGITGHSATHIPPSPADANCQDCHNTLNWKSSGKPDHTAFGPNDCKTCHAGAGTATHKSGTHFASSDQCATCHTTVTFKPATFDHTDAGVPQGPTSCFTCHNGLRPPADGKSAAPLGHVKTSDVCASCHIVAPTWVTTIKIHSVADPVVVAATCVSCHDGSHPPATPKSNLHFKTSTDCASCHTLINWTVGIGKFNHSDPVAAGATCVSCHDGAPTHAPALGKSSAPAPGHLPTSNTCETCHNTGAWKPAVFDHTTVVPGTCFTCHNGTKATGKTPTHFATSNTCDVCHNTTLWKPAKAPFHADTGITGTCLSCHNGTRLPAIPKSALHIKTTTLCESCHTTANWLVAKAAVDHTQVQGICSTCHVGTTKTASFNPVTPKGPTHITTSNTCDLCHTTVNWTATAVAHSDVTGTCVSCHNGTKATGKLTISGKHITTSDNCVVCHATKDTKTKAAPAWKMTKAAMIPAHTDVTGACFSCHNGTTNTLSFVPVSFKSAAHITTSNTCNLCHGVVANWVATVVDHTQVTGTCFSCHNGTKATGMTSISGLHFKTTTSCNACHLTKDTKTKLPAAWKIASKAAFDHSQATGTCVSCHATTAKPPAIDVKSATHFITTQPCESCHTTTLWTTFLPYTHMSPTYVMHTAPTGVVQTAPESCYSCHKQKNEKITFLSPSLVPDCAACHSDKYKPDPHTKFGNTKYTAAELRDCTGACHIYSSSALTTITTNRPTNTKHRPTRNSWN